ncbi:MAG: fatty acid desaturase [Deltaproteobacteria bacterium]|nr:fatty acid desaturase [Deltaproteobacteria bacterium]
MPLLSPVIGLAFAGLMFLGHETMHGAVVRGRWAKSLIGFLCFAPLAVSPRLWNAWHNRTHHANANRLGVDPDMYPSLERYQSSGVIRFSVDNFALGGRRWRGLLSLAMGFSVQSVSMLIRARTRLQLSRRAHRLAILETALLVGSWIVVAAIVGAIPFVFVYVVPTVIANVVIMSFILTNHSLSPATEDNDPLLGALSVTSPRWVEWLTLGFGYHVEHHLFPAASARHGRTIRTAILEAWPERYASMPHRRALAALFRTGRVYRDATTLVDPRSRGAWQAPLFSHEQRT